MRSSLSLALVLDRFVPRGGGLEDYSRHLARWLVERGHRVSIVAFEGEGEPGIELHRVSWSPSVLERGRRASEVARALGVDVVHDTGTAASSDVFHPLTGCRMVNLERDLASRPAFVRWLHRLSPRFRRHRQALEELERAQFRNAGHIIAASRMIRDHVSHLHGRAGRHVSLISNGVDTGSLPDRAAAPVRELRGRLAGGGRCLFVTIANNFQLKGIDTVLAALRLLGKDRDRVHVVVAGKGDVAGYSRRARRLGVEGAITFLGWCGEIPALHAAADVSLQPSHYDACALATLEGLAAGAPAITTRVNGASDHVQDGVHGIVLEDSRDVGALAGAMRRMLDPGLRETMIRAVRGLGDTLERGSRFEEVERVLRGVVESRTFL